MTAVGWDPDGWDDEACTGPCCTAPPDTTLVLVDQDGEPLCTCTLSQRCPNCPPDTKEQRP